MNQRLLVMGLMAVSIVLSGCANKTDTLMRVNNARIMNLQRGMTPEQAINHIGPSGDESTPNPFKSELYPAGNVIFRILYFYSQRQRVEPRIFGVEVLNGIITDDELMPVVFKDDKLDGWGWNYWEDTAKKYEIVVRNR